MERSTILRWIIIAVAIWAVWTFGPKLWGGGSNGTTEAQPLGHESACDPANLCAPEQRPPETFCEIQGVRYKAQLTSQGGSLKHFWVEGDRYRYSHDDIKLRQELAQEDPQAAVIVPGPTSQIDLVTSPDVEKRRPLRFDWRGAGADLDNPQVKFDAIDYSIVENTGKQCVFSYKSDLVELRRVVRATDRPFELEVESTITNLAQDKRKHALEVELVDWRYEKEVASHLGRQSPYLTTVTCAQNAEATRKNPGDFEPSDFKAEDGYVGGWFTMQGANDFASVSNFYFAQALMPKEPAAGACKLQVEHLWNRSRGGHTDDPTGGSMYRARLGYAPRELNPGESATYKMVAFFGPKERDVLAATAGGGHHLTELVDLGYFSIIAKGLLYFLVWLHGLIGNWGVAIILMTIGVRTVLFPLTWKSIQSGLSMRRLKPEIDALNAKYKDDPQQKNIATMELWKKHKVNPLGGCLPALFQLPVWWALFQSLQTAVELYHTPFLWFRDLSAPDPYYIIPFVLGGTMIIQQKMMPMQMDPMQQKMMTFVMPAVFTVMMLFLPSGLAVYMLTNAVLGILQQLAIEKYWSGQAAAVPAGSGITVTEKSDKPSGGRK